MDRRVRIGSPIETQNLKKSFELRDLGTGRRGTALVGVAKLGRTLRNNQVRLYMEFVEQIVWVDAWRSKPAYNAFKQKLLVTESDDWVYAGGAASREEGRGGGNGDQDDCDGDEGRGVGGADAVEEAGEEAR